MKDNMDSVWQLIRYGLLWIGTVLTTRGVTTSTENEIIIGAIMSLLPVLWGVYVRWNTKAVPVEVARRPDVPTVSQATGKINP